MRMLQAKLGCTGQVFSGKTESKTVVTRLLGETLLPANNDAKFWDSKLFTQNALQSLIFMLIFGAKFKNSKFWLIYEKLEMLLDSTLDRLQF